MRDMRLGRFKVSKEVLERISRKDSQILAKDLVILESKYDVAEGCQKYVANHPDFDIVEMDQPIPEYIAIFNKGSDSVRWEKV